MNLTVNPLTDTLHNRNYQAWEDVYSALESTYVICVESQYGNINGSNNECQFIACNCLDSNCSFERVILNFDGAMFENSRDGNSSELK